MKRPVICLACAHIFESEEIDQIDCPSCGHQMDAVVFDNLMKYSAVAMRFGYQYRNTYERNLAKGLEEFYCLVQFGTVFQFLGIAVLSGIIGNASYDIVKHIVKKLSCEKTRGSQWQQELLKRLQLDEIEFQKLNQYLDDFVKGKHYEPRQVAKLCQDELLIDSTGLVKSVFDILKSEQSKSRAIALVTDRIKKVKQGLPPPSAEYFSGCWSGVEIHSKDGKERNARETIDVKRTKKTRKKKLSQKRQKKRRKGKN